MTKVVFAANRHMYAMFLRYFQLKEDDYRYASDRHSLYGLNHLNSQFILTDGYVVNPCFGSDRYMQVKRLAQEDNKQDFIIKKMMHQKDGK